MHSVLREARDNRVGLFRRGPELGGSLELIVETGVESGLALGVDPGLQHIEPVENFRVAGGLLQHPITAIPRDPGASSLISKPRNRPTKRNFRERP